MEALLTRLLPNVDWAEIGYASLDTLSMLGGSMLFTVLLGLPLGVLLFLTSPRQMFEQKAFYGFLSLLVNILRSVPFVILLIVMIPFTVIAAMMPGSASGSSALTTICRVVAPMA